MFGQQIINGLMLGASYSLVAIGYTLIFGVLGLLYFAHGEVFMVGAFVGLYLVLYGHANIYVALVGAMITCAMLGVMAVYIAVRPVPKDRPLAPLISTIGLTIVLFTGVLFFAPTPLKSAEELPSQLSDEAFWRMVSDFSEDGGYFRSDNFMSNENTLQYVIPELQRSLAPGGVYIGVGPEQNFTYIAALRPQAARPDRRRRGLAESRRGGSGCDRQAGCRAPFARPIACWRACI